MTAPRLPAVERLADDLAGQVLETTPGHDALWRIGGPATAGKTAMLSALARRLAARNLVPIVVSPPAGELDSGPVALIELGSGLKAHGLIDGQLSLLQEPERPWAEKIADVRGWLEQHAGEVVLLCDEPMDWPASAPEDSHFGSKAHDVIRLVLDAVSCRRVITGRLPRGQKLRGVQELSPSSDPESWLNAADSWGPLAEPASTLAKEGDAALSAYSPLELRLLVALTALTSASDVSDWVSLHSRRQIARRLAEEISRRAELRSLCDIWARLALVRQPFDQSILTLFGAERLAPIPQAILCNCLLYTTDERYVMHDTLRADARDRGWLRPSRVREAHRVLGLHYADAFESGACAPHTADESLLLAMEAFHHVTMAADPALTAQIKPFFVDQLDALGRALSRRRRYSQAVALFRQSIEWDPGDDYAHHYLAFNLDVQGRQPAEVEKHYREAIRLDRENVWWRSRWINFLLVRGRSWDARREWDDALDALGLPDPNADPSIYEDLHLRVARTLLHRGELDFAERVLRGMPRSLRDGHPGLRASQRRLEALLEAQRAGAFVPGILLSREWWKRGPFLLERPAEGARLAWWCAGRIDEIEDGEIHLRVARVEPEPGAPPVVESLVLDLRTFDQWSADEKAASLDAGRFVEIGAYGKGRRGVTYRLRVHQDTAWIDDGLPRLWPDPTRYLKKAFPRNS